MKNVHEFFVRLQPRNREQSVAFWELSGSKSGSRINFSIENFNTTPKRVWQGVSTFPTINDKVFKFYILGFGGGMRSNECPSSLYCY